MKYKKILGIIGLTVVALSTLGVWLYQPAPKISVVMSTYNRGTHLIKAIDSILTQTEPDFEFIIINDGSTDSTKRILAAFARKDKRIKVLDNDGNKGLIYSLNRGLDVAKGKYIARMDDDDVSLPTRFERQLMFMEANPDIAVVGTWIGRPDNGNAWPFQQETDPDAVKIDMYMNNVPIAHPASFVRRDFIEKHGIRYNAKYVAAEDRKFWLDILDAGGNIVNIPEVLLLFRIHGTNPMEYYVNQAKNKKLFWIDEIFPRFDIEKTNNFSNCQILEQMLEENKKKKILNQNILEKKIQNTCKIEKVSHRLWKDAFVFEKNRVCRQKFPKECAKVISKTKDNLVIQWDKWGEEKFIRKKDEWHLSQ